MINELWNSVASQLQTNQVASAGVITAGAMTLGASLWTIAKSWPLKIYSYFYRRFTFSATIEHSDPIYKYIDQYFSETYPHKFRKVEIETKADLPDEEIDAWDDEGNYTHKSYTTVNPIKLAHENDYVIFWHNCRRIKASKMKEKLEAARNTYDMFRKAYVFSGLFARTSILDLISKIRVEGIERDRVEKEQKRVVKLYTHASHGAWSSSTPLKGKGFDSIFLAHKEELKQDLDAFLSKKSLYQRLRVPYKRGFLFLGAPGNGKSATAFAIADYLKYDIYSLNVSALYPESFLQCVERIPSNSIILIEDIDGYYDKRKSINQNKLSFAQFINALSGIDNKENVLTIFTTNHPEKLDPALIRDGRCDKRIEFKNPIKEQVQEFLKHVLGKEVNLPKYAPNKCFAEVQNIVLKNIDDENAIVKLLTNS